MRSACSSGSTLSARARVDLRSELGALSAQAVNESSRQVIALTDSRLHAAEQVVAPVRDSLQRLNDRLGSLETQGASWQAQLKQQVESVHLSGTELQRETRALAEALRRPQVRGQWGEMQLKRSLELSGLTTHCTFQEQVSRRTVDGIQRPDVVVTMAGGKQIVIDAKVSLDAFLTATHAADDEPALRTESFIRHAKQVRQHVDQLAAKAYWQQFEPAPEFVVMFLPAEALFSQALQTDPGLLDYAAGKGVLLATPTTLIAMLKTVAYAWTQEALADNAREVHQLGRELYDRLGTVGGHLDALGRSINTAVVQLQQGSGLAREAGPGERATDARPQGERQRAARAAERLRVRAAAHRPRAGRRRRPRRRRGAGQGRSSGSVRREAPETDAGRRGDTAWRLP